MAVSTSKSEEKTSGNGVPMDIVNAADNECVKLLHFGEIQAEKALLLYLCEQGSLAIDASIIVKFGEMKYGLKHVSFVKMQELIALLILSAVNYAELEGISLLESKFKAVKLSYQDCINDFRQYISFLQTNDVCPRLVNLFENPKVIVAIINVHLSCVQKLLKASSSSLDTSDEKKSDRDNRVSDAFESLLNGLVPTLNGVIENVIGHGKMDLYHKIFLHCGEIANAPPGISIAQYSLKMGNISGLSTLKAERNAFSNTDLNPYGDSNNNLGGTTCLKLKAGPISMTFSGVFEMMIAGLLLNYQFDGSVKIPQISGISNCVEVVGSIVTNPFEASVKSLVLPKINIATHGGYDIKLSGLSSIFAGGLNSIEKEIRRLARSIVCVKVKTVIKNVINDALGTVLPIRIGKSKNEASKQVALNVDSLKSFNGVHFRKPISLMRLSPMIESPMAFAVSDDSDANPLQQAFQSMLDTILFSFTSNDNVMALACEPATMIDPSITAYLNDPNTTDQAGYLNALLQFSQLFDVIPTLGNGMWVPGQNRVSVTWKDLILANAKSNTALTPAQQKTLNEANTQLWIPASQTVGSDGTIINHPQTKTSEFAAYTQYQTAYNTQVTLMNNAKLTSYNTNPQGQPGVWNGIKGIFEAKVQEAETNWEQSGFKQQISAALETVASLSTQGTQTAIANASSLYSGQLITVTDTSTSNSVTFAPVLLNPNNMFSNQFESWQSLSINSNNINQTYTQIRDEVGGSASFSDGVFSVGGSASGGVTHTNFGSDTTNVSITAEYGVANLYLPWYSPEFMKAQNWYMEGQQIGSISTGNVGQNIANQQNLQLAAVPSQLVIVKSFTVSANWGSEATEAITKHVSGSTTFGIGPFCITGNYSNSSTSTQQFASFNNGELKMSGPPQVIAVICQVPTHAAPQATP